MAKIEQILKADGPRRASVLFFHGLDGDPHTTWGAKNKDGIDQHFWPAWLKAEVKDISVYSVGAVSAFLPGNVGYLRALLETPELQDGPLFLVGHSLGGLVIKQLIRTAEGDASV